MQPNQREDIDPLLKPYEVAELFRVDVKTVSRWADQGRIECIRTPGNQRRFRESVVRALLAGNGPRQELPGQLAFDDV